MKFSDYFNHIVESIVLNFENRKLFFGKVSTKTVSKILKYPKKSSTRHCFCNNFATKKL